MTERPLLASSSVAPAVAAEMGAFQAEVIGEVKGAVSRDDIVVVGMAQNPHVKNVRKALTEAGLKFTYLEYGSYFSEWRKRLAVKLWSGWPTFPQVFVRGVLIGGEDLTKAALADGSLRARLEGASRAGVAGVAA